MRCVVLGLRNAVRCEIWCYGDMVIWPALQARAFALVKYNKRERERETKGNKIRNGCLTPAFSGASKRAKMLRHPYFLGDPQRQARGAKIQKWSPTKGNKISSGYLTPAMYIWYQIQLGFKEIRPPRLLWHGKGRSYDKGGGSLA